ncbi:malto-oligosyltrehalose synthase [Pseudorhizobium endolithicum]|uniref:Malto-oligosyltrehalose synthase n=1 Tax=Pseudorhizobium endolithicum TaxID=1191678 RepID=A0ABN7JQ02_9HYPH|nr:malto-oligosyltrehalose synthase [Pseudorhizobium endolithicum]CAD7041718.1 malto-oligosyltrehalose synthase [Pseudorhizobium endolithicum]
MKIPTSTYRIQFRNGMTFERAAGLVPYLKQLGISHLYASPIFSATNGSTHGYDVTDANEFDPVLGGRDGFLKMSDTLREHGLGLILDIVPNHMAASLENPWWRDVVEHGQQSRYARYFDIDWSRRLTLPFLGDTFEEVLAKGELSVRVDPQTGKPALAYYDSYYPLTPSSYEGRAGEVLAISKPEEIVALHDRQPWRLMSWRDAPRELSYRRFFEITGLVGLRVEDPEVFEAAHRTVLDLVRESRVDGLRIDHVDGLADPKGYLERLRAAVGPDIYVVVEKILGEGELLPEDWPISGTTGYEFITALGNVLVDGSGHEALTVAYHAVAGAAPDPLDELREAKLLMANNNFEGEVSTLLKLALKLHEGDAGDVSTGSGEMQDALRELLVAFPVYRTYGTAEGMPAEGKALLDEVVRRVRTGPHAPDEQALGFLHRLLAGETGGNSDEALLFRIRFQQLTGPLMAKSLEDTTFFRNHRLLAMNEVGSEADPAPASVEHFHEEMTIRRQRQPDALSATSTHDTKRGEDARARLYTISEAPDHWAASVDRWREINSQAVAHLSGGAAPEPAVEWMLYQALAGVWPADLATDDRDGLKALEERFLQYVEKALREAKQRTTWSDPNEDYEGAVRAYASRLLSPDNQAFLEDFRTTLEPFLRTGLVNGITQTLVKLVAPGVPDIYQGSERLDLSLVDPDNRREPDFATLAADLAPEGALSTTEEDWRTGRLKQQVIARVLRLRREQPDLFRSGEYLALHPEGKRAANLLSFARRTEEAALVLIAPRLVLGAFRQGEERLSKRWDETVLPLPPALRSRSYRDLFTGRRFDPSERLSIAWAFVDHPFALLVST